MSSLTDDWSALEIVESSSRDAGEAAPRKSRPQRATGTSKYEVRQARRSYKSHAEVTPDGKLSKPEKDKAKRPSTAKLLSPDVAADGFSSSARRARSASGAPEYQLVAEASPRAMEASLSPRRRPSHRDRTEHSSPCPVERFVSGVSTWALDTSSPPERIPDERPAPKKKRAPTRVSAAGSRPPGTSKLTSSERGSHRSASASDQRDRPFLDEPDIHELFAAQGGHILEIASRDSAAVSRPPGANPMLSPSHAEATAGKADRERRRQRRESEAQIQRSSTASATAESPGLHKAAKLDASEQSRIRPKAKGRRKHRHKDSKDSEDSSLKLEEEKKSKAPKNQSSGSRAETPQTPTPASPQAEPEPSREAASSSKEGDTNFSFDCWLAPASAADEEWVPVIFTHDDADMVQEVEGVREPEETPGGSAKEETQDPAKLCEDRVKGVMEATDATTGEALEALEASGWNAELAVNRVIDERAQVKAAEEASKVDFQRSGGSKASGSSAGAQKRAQSNPMFDRHSMNVPTRSAMYMEEFLQPSPRATMGNPRSSSTPRSGTRPSSGGFLGRISSAASVFVDAVSGHSAEWLEALKKGASNVSADVSNRLSRELGAALARDDSRKVNLLVDSALGGALIGKGSPPIIRRAANDAASHQLKEALKHNDPKRLKGALVAARRLNATELPEFHAVVKRYKEVKCFPENWDVAKMLHGRKGDKLVAKQKVSDPAVVQRFQRLLDSTHRKVYTRDRGGEEIPDRLKLVKVVEVANDELYVDYMARQEAIRREIKRTAHDFWQVTVDTSLIADGDMYWPGDDWEARYDGGDANMDNSWSLTDPPLDRDVNEVLLFHGTSHVASDIITTENFSVDFAGSYAGTLYGRGVYLAENASKSDEYTRPDPETGNRTVLVCRVTLGRMFYTDQVTPDPRNCENACLNGPYHSVLGDRLKCRGTFREFVVFDEEQIYAAYILTYRRVRTTAKHGTE